MKNLVTAVAVALSFGAALAIHETRRIEKGSQSDSQVESEPSEMTSRPTVRAPGRIQGRTDEVELRARIEEQVREIRVAKGHWVHAGDVLVRLDSERLEEERDLARAMLSEAEARLARLENGLRDSEIETARQEYVAASARLVGAEKTYARAEKLARSDAISHQSVDELHAKLTSLRALAAAARGRLQTVELPPREDDRMAAEASVRAAQSRLRIAQINLDRTEIKSPIDGRVLAVETEVGELTGPESEMPLVVLSDTRDMRTVAEVDEFDALKVRIGQACQITADGSEGILARGEIVEIEPQMNPKRLYGQWAGERNDTYSRRVWIALRSSSNLPVGLPVDVFIEID